MLKGISGIFEKSVGVDSTSSSGAGSS